MQKGIAVLIIALIVVSMVALLLFYSSGGSSNERGLGAQNTQGAQEQRSLWLIVFAVPLAVASVIAVYSVLFPKIKLEKTITQKAQAPAVPIEKSQNLNAVVRVLNEDERKVVNALASSADGAMLQKDIRWKTGFSRVKTHRVLSRLAARGIVKAEKYYNTNRIVLADWIANNKESQQ